MVNDLLMLRWQHTELIVKVPLAVFSQISQVFHTYILGGEFLGCLVQALMVLTQDGLTITLLCYGS